MERSGIVAIVGGGPAGSVAAERIARSGKSVVLFDEKLAWEKPCGGGLTQKALTQYPFLREAAVERNLVERCEFISPAGRRTMMKLDQPVAIFSRTVLNGMLLDRAHAAGAELCRERVTEIERVDGRFRLRTKKSEIEASFVVLAAGARNPFRAQFYKAYEPSDLLATVGYFIPGSSKAMQVQFLEGIDGYIWTFPRADHFSAGIAGRINETPTAELRRRLDQFLVGEGYSLKDAKVYAHILPSLTEAKLRRLQYAGDGWAMAGDAAGFVDPVTGEGLYYAIRSGDLLAQALVNGKPEQYQKMAERDFLPELIQGAGYAERFYHGTFMGQQIVERLVQFAAESKKFRELLCDLFTGVQGYIGLKGRAYRTLPHLAGEFVGSIGGWA